MCGIAVIFGSERPPPDKAVVGRMLDTMPHRGPNARGTFADGRIALGHVRLSIIDLTDDANQPMSDHRGRTIVFNGEIYNYRELRRQLAAGHEFRTQSDTEVILAAYDAWGEDCVRRFNGDWAFALYDRPAGRLFVSRDRLGVKPLYYAFHDGQFLAASEVRALVAGGVPGTVGRQQVIDFIKRGKSELEDEALVSGVKVLPPGCSLTVDPLGVCTQREYWGENELFGATVPADFEEAVEAFGDVFLDSVRLRLHADVPVGVCLSGGLDSSLITALASGLGRPPLCTFSGVAPGYASDEGRFSEAVSRMYGTRHVPVPLIFDDFLDALPRFVHALDSPAAGVSTVARLLVLERAGRDVTVLLDGQGGDELLVGYYRFHREFRKLRPECGFQMDPREERERSAVPVLAEFEPDFIDGLAPKRNSDPEPTRSVDPITRMQYRSLRGPGLQTLLHTEDRLTMICSLEGRVPFLDHRLVEFCFSSPLEYRIADMDKRLARRLAQGRSLLPEEVIGRRDKKGFATPYVEMLQRDPSARAAIAGRIATLTERVPGIFRRQPLLDLLEEHAGGEIDNSARIFRPLTTMLHLDQTGYSIAD